MPGQRQLCDLTAWTLLCSSMAFYTRQSAEKRDLHSMCMAAAECSLKHGMLVLQAAERVRDRITSILSFPSSAHLSFALRLS